MRVDQLAIGADRHRHEQAPVEFAPRFLGIIEGTDALDLEPPILDVAREAVFLDVGAEESLARLPRHGAFRVVERRVQAGDARRLVEQVEAARRGRGRSGGLGRGRSRFFRRGAAQLAPGGAGRFLMSAAGFERAVAGMLAFEGRLGGGRNGGGLLVAAAGKGGLGQGFCLFRRRAAIGIDQDDLQPLVFLRREPGFGRNESQGEQQGMQGEGKEDRPSEGGSPPLPPRVRCGIAQGKRGSERGFMAPR